jgi:cytochrome b pre-mRNA-processing protein 3
MFAWLSRRSHRRRNARELYGSIVTQARTPIFYTAWGVPDTIAGRFEMVVVHLSVVLDRLQAEAGAEVEPAAALARALTEAFIADMDASMREMTFGDLAVPKEVKRTAAALFDRHSAYRGPLRARQAAAMAGILQVQLAYLGAAGGMDVDGLAHYMCEAADAIGRQRPGELTAPGPAWPVAAPLPAPVQDGRKKG